MIWRFHSCFRWRESPSLLVKVYSQEFAKSKMEFISLNTWLPDCFSGFVAKARTWQQKCFSIAVLSLMPSRNNLRHQISIWLMSYLSSVSSPRFFLAKRFVKPTVKMPGFGSGRGVPSTRGVWGAVARFKGVSTFKSQASVKSLLETKAAFWKS